MHSVLLRISSVIALTVISLQPLGVAAQAKPFDSVLVKRAVLARALDDISACRADAPIWHKPTLTEQAGRVALTADGRVLLHDMAMKKARLFSPNGAEVAQLGGEGAGPGEFGSVAAPLPWVADTVAMYDLRNSRLVLFTAHGLAREINLTTMPIFAAGGVMGRLSTGDLILSAGLTPQDRPTSPTGKFRGIMKAVRWRPGAATVDTVRDGVRGGEWYPMMFGKQQGVSRHAARIGDGADEGPSPDSSRSRADGDHAQDSGGGALARC